MTTADIKRTTLPAATATPRPVLAPIDGVAMADSRNVAAMFGKRHNNVLRDIRGLLGSEQTLAGRFFREATYTDPTNGQAYPHFLMDRDGFALLAMGFTGARATRWKLEYLTAFNAMEAELRKRAAPVLDLDDNATLRRLLMGRIERVEALEAKVEETSQALVVANRVIEADAPKVEAYDYLLDGIGTCNLANAARILGAEQKAFFRWLRRGGYVFDQGDSTLPRADLRRDGHFRVRLVRVSRDRHVEQTLVTRQGLIWLTHRWAAKLARETREAAAARIQGELGV